MNPVDKWTKKWRNQLSKVLETQKLPKPVVNFFEQADVVGFDTSTVKHRKVGALKSSEIHFLQWDRQYVFRFFESPSYTSPIRLDGKFHIEVDGSPQVKGKSLASFFDLKGTQTKVIDDLLKSFITGSKRAKLDFQATENKKRFQEEENLIDMRIVDCKKGNPSVFFLEDGTELIKRVP